MKPYLSRSTIFAFLLLLPTLVFAESAKVYLVTPELTSSQTNNRLQVLNQLFESAFFRHDDVDLLPIEPIPNAQCRDDSCLVTLGYQRHADLVAPYSLLESDGTLVLTLRLLDVHTRRTVAMESITVQGGFAAVEAGHIQQLVAKAVHAVPAGRPLGTLSRDWRQVEDDAITTEADATQHEPRLIILGGGNFNLYMMNDVNDEIAQLRNAGLSIDEISSAGGFHAGARIMPSKDLQLGLEYRSLQGSTSGSDYSGSIRYDVSADVYEMIMLFRTSYNPHADLFIGFGVGQYISKGSLTLNVPGYFSAEGDIDGQKIGVRPILELQMIPDENLRLGFYLSYRFAEMTDLEVNGNKLEDYSLDYSGFNVGVSLMFVI